jgi:hypothetical protein
MRPLRATPAVPGTLSAPIHVVSHVFLVLCARRALLAEGGSVCDEVMWNLRLIVAKCAAHHKGYLPKVIDVTGCLLPFCFSAHGRGSTRPLLFCLGMPTMEHVDNTLQSTPAL